MALITVGDAYPGEDKNVDEFDVLGAFQLMVQDHTPTLFTLVPYAGDLISLVGTGFTYGAGSNIPTGGVITRIFEVDAGKSVFDITGLNVPLPITSNAGFLAAALGGADVLNGSADVEIMHALGGDDVLNGLGGADQLFGDAGNDTIDGGSGPGYLRGGEGNDRLTGGDVFDDLQGNQGNDTESGGGGSDWVVGGKDDDQLNGDQGDDVVLGNIGNDTVNGGVGADIVRGGQGNDVVSGGDGADWLSGDRGDDTVTGGAGADVFHGFADSGSDRVTDFTPADGDRVFLLPGTSYTVSQVGADTVVAMGGGAQLILVGVQQSTLTDGWIF